ncbi:zinc finger protein 425-like [Leptopilina boulardi]|uniref:zinc finger protein 425-like n=1 Tax=Leptopilina boulardi TaxID=63433 RepID=UPI0021F5F677|nr:zinc finger protein 425-like [Leptopilina boulardi]
MDIEDDCPPEDISHLGFFHHVQQQQSSSSSNVADLFPCDKCGVKFARRDVLFDHIFSEHFDQKLTPKKEFPCENCHRSYTSRSNLRRHQRQECNTEPQFVCPFCFPLPHVEFNYLLHSSSSNESSSIFTGKNINEGTSSSSKYYSPTKIQSNSEKSSVKKPFKCPKCDRTFAVKGNMNRHLKYECNQAPKFSCPYCYFRSKQSSNVLAHIRARHSGQNAYVINLRNET